MKVVLRADVPGVGKRGDITEVSDGFARNYLVPQGHAIIANVGIEDQAASMRRSRDLEDARNRESAETVARKLVPIVFRIEARSGSRGQALRIGDRLGHSRGCRPSVRSRARSPSARHRGADQDHRVPRGGCAPARRRRVPPHLGGREFELSPNRRAVLQPGASVGPMDDSSGRVGARTVMGCGSVPTADGLGLVHAPCTGFAVFSAGNPQDAALASNRAVGPSLFQ